MSAAGVQEQVHAAPGDIDVLLARARELARRGGKGPAILGIVGAPGAGKSTLAAELVAALSEEGVAVAQVPMDGLHLSRRACEALGRLDRRGAPDTFDAAGYLHLLRRIGQVARTGETVWAPCFEREVHDPVAGDVPVTPDTELVVTEGNYLLLDEPHWREIPDLLAECWYLRPEDDAVRLHRLISRHVTYGRTPQAARAHAEGSDQPNARLVAATAARADLLVHWAEASAQVPPQDR